MIPSLDLSAVHLRPRNDRLVALFLLGLVLFTPPLLRVFGVSATVFGCPLLFVYIFLAWGILVLLIAIDVERRDQPRRSTLPPPDHDAPGGAKGPRSLATPEQSPGVAAATPPRPAAPG